MKNLLILILLLCSIKSIAQTDTFEFKLIDSVNASKQDLYLKARQFISLQFKDSKEVIQMDDKDAGKIICKGIMEPTIKAGLGITVQSFVNFTITIDVKDGKYRCILNDFYHDGFVDHQSSTIGGNLNNDKPDCGWGMTNNNWRKVKEATKIDAADFLSDMKIEMSKSTKSDDF